MNIWILIGVIWTALMSTFLVVSVVIDWIDELRGYRRR